METPKFLKISQFSIKSFHTLMRCFTSLDIEIFPSFFHPAFLLHSHLPTVLPSFFLSSFLHPFFPPCLSSFPFVSSFLASYFFSSCLLFASFLFLYFLPSVIPSILLACFPLSLPLCFFPSFHPSAFPSFPPSVLLSFLPFT